MSEEKKETILEHLASHLDREITKYDSQQAFMEGIDFLNLCFEARRILLEEKALKLEEQSLKEGKNVTNNQ